MNEIDIIIRSNRFALLTDAMVDELDTACETSAEAIMGDAVQSMMNSPATGRTYKRGKVTHQASAEGEPPAVDTTALSGSGAVRRVGRADYLVVFSTPYAEALEYGYPPHNLAARPFLRPAVGRERPRLTSVVRSILRRTR